MFFVYVNQCGGKTSMRRDVLAFIAEHERKGAARKRKRKQPQPFAPGAHAASGVVYVLVLRVRFRHGRHYSGFPGGAHPLTEP